MPPKAKPGKKGKKQVVPVDDIDTSLLTREKLEQFCQDVYESLMKERRYTEFLRLERDKLSNMTAVAREHLTAYRDTNMKHEHELSDIVDRHRIKMWENRQKLIQLAGEKNIDCLNTKLYSVAKLDLEGKNHYERMQQIIKDTQDFKERLDKMVLNYAGAKTEMDIEHAELKCNIREKNKELEILMENKREKTMNNKLKTLETMFDKEYNGLEKRKENEIAEMIAKNCKYSTELKYYYNGIVHHNLSIINVMKTDFINTKEKNAGIEKLLMQLRKTNQELNEELFRSEIEVEILRKQLSSSKKDKNMLKFVKRELQEKQIILQHKTIELDVLNMSLEKHNEEIDRIKAVQDHVVISHMSTHHQKILLLEFIVLHLYNKLKEVNSKLNELKRILMKKSISKPCFSEIEDMKDTALDDMVYQVERFAGDRKQIMAAFNRLLKKHDLHKDDLGFKPLKNNQLLKAVSYLRVLVNENEI